MKINIYIYHKSDKIMENLVLKRMKAAMAEKNITKSELSKRTGISNSSISEYLSGKYSPKQDKIYTIATALQVTPSWLMGFDHKDRDGNASNPSIALNDIYEVLNTLDNDSIKELNRFIDYLKSKQSNR